MAFPLPQHLPRAGFSGETSSFGSTSSHAEPFLKRIATLPLKDFKHSSATSWLRDLDAAVDDTKERIHARINSDLSQFEGQLESSRQVQTRLKSLSASVEDLDDALNGVETGLLPGIIRALRSQSTLSQEAMDINARREALSHLLKCRNFYRQLASLADAGRLPEAIQHYEANKDLTDSITSHLSNASLALDMKRKLRILVDRVQEQLALAYQKSVILESSATGATFNIARQIPIGSTTHDIELGAVMNALPPGDLEKKLSSLRKDILQKLVVPVLVRRARTKRTSDGPFDRLEVEHGSPVADPLLGLETLLRHIRQSLLPSLPPTQQSTGIVVDPPPVDEEDGSAWDFDDTPSTDIPSFTTAIAPASEISISETGSTEPQPPDTPANPPEEEDAADGWGFDDDMEPTSPPPPENTGGSVVSSDAATGASSTDQGNGWGFDDDEPQSPLLSVPTSSSVKPARGLDRFSAHHKAGSPVSGSSSGFVAAPTKVPVPTISSPPRKKPIERPREDESYLVSSTAVKLLDMAEQAMAEARHLLDSDIFGKGSPRRGHLLLSVVPSILDLYRALYPIAHANTLGRTRETRVTYSAGEAMQFSNDCKYLSQEGRRLQKEITELDAQSAKTKLGETDERLKAASDAWLDDTLDYEIDAVEKLISKAQGFSESGDDAKFEQYRATVELVLAGILETSRSWKPILTRTAYLNAIGALVDDTLARMIEEITSLPDIPELESHRLSELLRILTGLEDLFSEGENSPVVMHVPLWLKFSYLAELLEASMNDISYLFDEGALIDFTVDELVRLVRALFADTPLRTRIIEKISAGHPLPSY
ncbi:hypothetical protein FRB90_002458 [Tulasnella sp. 427]|nr:hypothetical protein FRB90_002458 [Tulasnella sp. 427]